MFFAYLCAICYIVVNMHVTAHLKNTFLVHCYLQPSRWPQYGKNTETVGELWLGLLRFYTEEFDFREHVVCIRQHARLTTFNKQWTSKYIVIEGDFALH